MDTTIRFSNGRRGLVNQVYNEKQCKKIYKQIPNHAHQCGANSFNQKHHTIFNTKREQDTQMLMVQVSIALTMDFLIPS